MDTSDLQITFDENGYCNHCTEFLDLRARFKYNGPASDAAFAKTIAAIRTAGRGRDYDCIIGMSGGIDSSYLAYIAKQNDLRPLAVHMDNGWDSPEAVLNIRNVTTKLGIDYESYVLDWEEFKNLQLSFLKASVPEAETPTDIAIPAALHHFAVKYGIKYVLGGGNLVTEGILPRSWHYNAKDLKYFNHIHRLAGGRELKNFPTFGYKKEIYFKLIKRIRTVYPLDQVPFAKDDAMELLTREFGWKYYGGKHYESRYTRFIQSYYLYEKFGIDYRRASFSSQILCGQVDREWAVEELKRKPYQTDVIEADKQFVAKKLGISLEELEEICTQPAKWYWDYPNDETKLSTIYNAYRKIFHREKLAGF